MVAAGHWQLLPSLPIQSLLVGRVQLITNRFTATHTTLLLTTHGWKAPYSHCCCCLLFSVFSSLSQDNSPDSLFPFSPLVLLTDRLCCTSLSLSHHEQRLPHELPASNIGTNCQHATAAAVSLRFAFTTVATATLDLTTVLPLLLLPPPTAGD